MTAVMEGVRILEVAEHTFVPAASAILADWGADVIKIEHVTRGDAARGLGSTGIAGFSGKVAVLMEHANRGKKSLGLDLTKEEGRDILYQLAAISDVFLTNKMAGVRSRLQIEVDDIRAHNPIIVYFGTSDGRFIMFSMLQGFHYWPEVCERLERPDLIGDSRFDTHEHLMENAGAGADLIRAEIKKYTLAEITERLTGMRGQWAIVQDTIEIADDPQVVA